MICREQTQTLGVPDYSLSDLRHTAGRSSRFTIKCIHLLSQGKLSCVWAQADGPGCNAQLQKHTRAAWCSWM